MERPLSDMERAFWLLDRGTSFNGVQVVTLRGPIDDQLLKVALKRLQQRHPLLRVRVVGDDKNPSFTDEDAGPIPLWVVRRQSDTHWQKLVETELNHRFAPSADSLTRCVLVLGPVRSELIFAHHHVTADALSLVFAVRDLLTDMAQLAQGQAASAVESLPLRPPLSRLLPASARGLSRFRHMTAFFNKHILLRPLRRARKLPLENAVPPRERSNRILHRSLNPEQTHRLAELAKQEGTTVHAALCSALLLSVAATAYQEEVAQEKRTTVGCFSAVSLRQQLEPSVGEEMGLYISQVTTFHQVVPMPSLWQLAREVKEQLSETLDNGEQYLTMPLIGMFIPPGRDPGPRFIRTFDGGSPAAIGVTNIARLPIPSDYGALQIENYQIAVGLSVVGQLLGAVTTFAGTLNLNLIYVEPLVSTARATQILDGAMRHLDQALAAQQAA